MKYCVMEEGRVCINCGKCNICDLNPNKICDNCCKCLEENDQNYRELKLSDFFEKMNSQWTQGDHAYNEPAVSMKKGTKVIIRYNKKIKGKRNIDY